MDSFEALSSSVNYEEAPLAQLEVDGVEYRVDPGQGSAVAVSAREPGTWDWRAVAEGRWDGSRLRARGLSFPVTSQLGAAVARAMLEREGGTFA